MQAKKRIREIIKKTDKKIPQFVCKKLANSISDKSSDAIVMQYYIIYDKIKSICCMYNISNVSFGSVNRNNISIIEGIKYIKIYNKLSEKREKRKFDDIEKAGEYIIRNCIADSVVAETAIQLLTSNHFDWSVSDGI